MSDEHWRAQSAPEAIRDQETARIQAAARQRGEDMPADKAREAADRVIAGREAFDRRQQERAEAAGREIARAGGLQAWADRERAPDPARGGGQMMPGQGPREQMERIPQLRTGRTGRGQR